MRITRMAARFTAVASTVLGLSLATAGPAAATEAGSWRAYGNTNPITSSPSTWHCASTKTVVTDVLAQVCAIRSSGGGAVQAAVIVRNNRSSLYSVTAAMDLYTSSGGYLGDWVCSSSGVGANSWSVCFGRTLTQSSPVNSVGAANGVGLGKSSNV
ncbi:hypothetical protein HXZ27_31405 [Micromonospora carbonacea subsp. aurantiaca]|uniref:Secreted protein n=2 Tax=Micromonospora carbonacea TaxID=47853 RepID=A0A7H8XWD9_9ACTN|nr:hypothetical protein HXZ27_31405 [Micromonospora carbonacea]